MSGATDENNASAAGSGGRWRTAVITFFPMLIAVLSLVTSIYNGYLNNRFVSLIQGNLGRSEYMRTCRDVIDAYFQVKYRVGVATSGSGAAAAGGQAAQIEAGNSVARFGALATYLANLRTEEIRARYTELYAKLAAYAGMSPATSAEDRAKLLKEADALFDMLNDDCVKSAQVLP